MEGRMKEILTTVGAATVGTVVSYTIYSGSRTLIKTDNVYIPAALELGVGVLLALTLRHPFWQIAGGVMIAQGLLDLMYAGNVLAVQL
ncbi:MAG: hypothetical protein NZ651_05045 [Candidatus Bipolaricaulota bacterium]|nr:hypothetical protein [Candidatus Bipolaricaulota bacterium]MDW8127120.1 hypothetical protein [Candidatus Bipolaricaulota bacterium]